MMYLYCDKLNLLEALFQNQSGHGLMILLIYYKI